jgi:hypothetical protein
MGCMDLHLDAERHAQIQKTSILQGLRVVCETQNLMDRVAIGSDS